MLYYKLKHKSGMIEEARFDRIQSRIMCIVNTIESNTERRYTGLQFLLQLHLFSQHLLLFTVVCKVIVYCGCLKKRGRNTQMYRDRATHCKSWVWRTNTKTWAAKIMVVSPSLVRKQMSCTLSLNPRNHWRRETLCLLNMCLERGIMQRSWGKRVVEAE